MSNNLALIQLAESQADKEITINDQVAQLDAALTDMVVVDLTGQSSPLVLDEADSIRRMMLKFTGTHPGGAFTVEVPASKKLYVAWNVSGGEVTVGIAGGTAVAAPDAALRLLYADGSDVQAVAGGTAVAGDGRVTVSADDTSPDHLIGKLTAGANVTLTELNDGGDEVIEITAAGGPAGQGVSRLLDDTSTANGSETGFTLAATPVGSLLVFIDGVLQDENDHAVSGATLTLTTAPPAGSHVIAYDGGNGGSVMLDLDDLGDVTLDAPAEGDVLRYDGTVWRNAAAASGATAPFRGALVRLDAALAISPAETIAWEAAEYDTDGFWSAASPSRLTVPQGVTRVRLHAAVSHTTSVRAGSSYGLLLLKNGEFGWTGAAAQYARVGYTNHRASCVTPVIKVSPGDHLEARVTASDGAVTLDATRSSFAIEAVGAAAGSPYEIPLFVAGTPGAGALLHEHVFARDVSFADDFTGSVLFARTAADAETVLDIQKNGTAIGTITVAASGTTGTFATTGSGSESFVAGDRLAIVNEDPADAALADLSIILTGTRT